MEDDDLQKFYTSDDEQIPDINAYFVNVDTNYDDDENDDDEDVDDEDVENYEEEEEDEADDSNIFLTNTSVGYLTREEKTIIDRCDNTNLRQALIYNRQQYAGLKKLSDALYAKMEEFRISLLKLTNPQQGDDEKKQQRRRSRKAYLYYPFFKVEASVPVPNADCTAIATLSEMTSSRRNESCKWTAEERIALMKSVCEHYYNYLKRRYDTELAALKKTCDANNAQYLIDEELKLRNLYLQERYPVPPRKDSSIDWATLARVNMKGKRTVEEYVAFWNVYLHPAINKSVWTPQENAKILQVANCHNCQNWDAIADEVGTDRSGFMIIIHFYTQLFDKFKRSRFTPEEDEHLLASVNRHRIGTYIPWPLVATAFKERSRFQLYHRYIHYLVCRDVKRGFFSEAEDILVLFFLKRNGVNHKQLVATCLPHRSIVQVRYRCKALLSRGNWLETGKYSEYEDTIILRHVTKYGKSNWSLLARILPRSANHLRQRYLTIEKYLDAHPGSRNPADFPRKDKQNLYTQKINRDRLIADIVEQLKNDFVNRDDYPTLDMVEDYVAKYKLHAGKGYKMANRKRAPYRKLKPTSTADKQLLQFFQVSFSGQRKHKFLRAGEVFDCAAALKNFLDILKVDNDLLYFYNTDNVAEEDKGSLTSIDIDIVQHLAKNAQSNHHHDENHDQAEVTTGLIPPSIWTVLGIRGLTITIEQLRYPDGDYLEELKQEAMEELLGENSNNNGGELIAERRRFVDRFVSLFTWPIILSKNRPNNELAIAEEHQSSSHSDSSIVSAAAVETVTANDVTSLIKIKKPPPAPPKKAGRPKKRMSEKVLKMNAARRKKKLGCSENEEEQQNAETTGDIQTTIKLEMMPGDSYSKQRRNDNAMLLGLPEMKSLLTTEGASKKFTVRRIKNDDASEASTSEDSGESQNVKRFKAISARHHAGINATNFERWRLGRDVKRSAMVTPGGSRGTSPLKENNGNKVAARNGRGNVKSSPEKNRRAKNGSNGTGSRKGSSEKEFDKVRSRGNSPLGKSSDSIVFPPSRGSETGSIERLDVSSHSRRLITNFNQSEDNINVAVRVRPLNAKEVKSADQFSVQFPGNGQILIDGVPNGGSANSKTNNKIFSYNVVFEPAATQEDILQFSGIKRLIEMAVEGFRCTAFCYGQTGSGKTHTLTGPPGLFDRKSGGYSDLHGLIFRSFSYLFQLLEEKSDTHFVLKASFLEIYNEKVIDLLNPGSARKPLAVRWSKKARGFFVENLFTVDCEELDDLTAVLEEGMRNRHVGSHNMNDHSSRSHTILTVHITSDQPAEGGVFLSRSGKINFVDLAGSEMTKKTQSEGKTLEEANNINKSLMVLGYCIASLSDNRRKNTHIPYRDSKLTKLLADSLAGNGVTLMIACISPARSNLFETINTLRYAARAKKIKSKPIVLMDPREALILSLKREVEALQSENEHLRTALHLHSSPEELALHDSDSSRRAIATPPQVDLDRLLDLEGTQLVELVRLYVNENEALRKENAELYVTREMMLRDQELVCRENERLLKKLEDVNSVCCRSPINPPRRNMSTDNLSLSNSNIWSNTMSMTSTFLPEAIQKELSKRRIGDATVVTAAAVTSATPAKRRNSLEDTGLKSSSLRNGSGIRPVRVKSSESTTDTDKFSSLQKQIEKKAIASAGRRFSLAQQNKSLEQLNGVTSPTEEWVAQQQRRTSMMNNNSKQSLSEAKDGKKLFGSTISLLDDEI